MKLTRHDFAHAILSGLGGVTFGVTDAIESLTIDAIERSEDEAWKTRIELLLNSIDDHLRTQIENLNSSDDRVLVLSNLLGTLTDEKQKEIQQASHNGNGEEVLAQVLTALEDAGAELRNRSLERALNRFERDHESMRRALVYALPILVEIERALKQQIKGCEERNVPFRTPHILLALLQLPESFSVFCLNQVQLDFAQFVKQKLIDFVARQPEREKNYSFQQTDLNQNEIILAAKELAFHEAAPLVTERHILCALLETQNLNTIEMIRSKLGAARFAQLVEIAKSKKTVLPLGRTPI